MSKLATARRIAETLENVWPNLGMEGFSVDGATAIIRKSLEGYTVSDDGDVFNGDGQRMWCPRDNATLWYPETPQGDFPGLRPVHARDIVSIGEGVCPACNGSGSIEEDTGGFTPWGAPISVGAPCPECNKTQPESTNARP